MTLVARRDHGLPYSKGLMAQSLMATGLSPERSYELAFELERRLEVRALPSISVEELRGMVEAVLGEREGDGAVERWRRWQRVDRLDSPLVVLIGGTAGTGKSTLATTIAHRLGITRLTSTDMIRHILRTFFAVDVMPDVHCSSFEARRAVRQLAPEGTDLDLLGFRLQAEHVASAVRALVDRAITERTPILLEGVHLVPGLLPDDVRSRALVVHAVLAVEDEEAHRSHFELRGEAQARGPTARYLDSFATIRKLQDHLVEAAEAAGVPVIRTVALDDAVAEMLGLVMAAVGVEGSRGS
ncbi:MAG TPA: hypothetical protein VF533_17645 [Solirubrobacteraceae bacterium]|jgi:2-phosphoglycerate kinase